MKYKLILDENNYLMGFVHTETSEDTFALEPSTMELEYLNCYKLVDGTLIFDEEKKAELIKEEETKVEEEKLKADKLEKMTSMFTITRERSDKLGQDWLIYTLGSVEVLREYVPSESHAGTLDDPIPFELGLELIPNAYYSFEEHLYVYMGQGGVVAESYPVDEVDGWVLWE